ncbi:MAG: HMA2 domain-containing protein, partial [Enterobacteriaceae bacterium]
KVVMEPDSLLVLRRFVEIGHHIPGRIRLRFTNRFVPLLAQSELNKLASYCRPDHYLRSYELNSTTGTLLLEYDASQLPPSLLEQIFADEESTAKQALEQLAQLISN